MLLPEFRQRCMLPGLALLESLIGIKSRAAAEVLLLTIAQQESGLRARLQVGGPARGFWQFEAAGVIGVQRHPRAKEAVTAMCAELEIRPDLPTIHTAIAWNDSLAVAMARLLLWTDSAPLPAVGDPDLAWAYYVRNWRPGKPHAATWPGFYRASIAALT